MSFITTTKMSSKGQIVIPEAVRQKLGLELGAQFVVMADKDVIILKTIAPPAMSDFSALIAKTRQQVKKAGIPKEAVKEAIIMARKKK